MNRQLIELFSDILLSRFMNPDVILEYLVVFNRQTKVWRGVDRSVRELNIGVLGDKGRWCLRGESVCPVRRRPECTVPGIVDERSTDYLVN